MGLQLSVFQIYIPHFVRKRKLQMLFNATADAFRVTSPSTAGLSYSDCLKIYAGFTREQADKTVLQENENEVQPRLFQNAQAIGRQFREDFNLQTAAGVMQMGSLIYKLLKIEFEGEPGGNITIKKCFFSDYYSSRVCRLISALDEGLLTGLAGGGNLRFSQRITEGNCCCKAYLEFPGRVE